MGFGSSGITWENIASSNVRGVELEGKKKIGEHIEFQANVTVVNSIAQFVRRDLQTIDGIKVYSVIDTINRPMFGQAPYLINGILNYQADSSKTILTLSYNVQGPRLVIAGAVRGRADVYELPRHTLDFKASRQLGKHFTMSLTVRDILNAPVRRSYDLPEGWVDYDSFRYGTNFILGFAYKL
jgi:outer membrane receptor protein involved in Fe transport